MHIFLQITTKFQFSINPIFCIVSYIFFLLFSQAPKKKPLPHLFLQNEHSEAMLLISGFTFMFHHAGRSEMNLISPHPSGFSSREPGSSAFVTKLVRQEKSDVSVPLLLRAAVKFVRRSWRSMEKYSVFAVSCV